MIRRRLTDAEWIAVTSQASESPQALAQLLEEAQRTREAEEEAKAVLREVEWAGNPDYHCPCCSHIDPEHAIEVGARNTEGPYFGLVGHAPDCRLAKALAT